VVNHQFANLHPGWAKAVNGHEPMIFHNVTTGYARIYCATCDWSAHGYARRWHAKVETEWRVHAGEIAMGLEVKHGETDSGCHCARCASADRQRAEAGRSR